MAGDDLHRSNTGTKVLIAMAPVSEALGDWKWQAYSRGRLVNHKESFISDQRGAVALEMPIVWLFMMLTLLLPLADLAIAGFKFISAHQALRDMGQRTQYSTPDATDSGSITNWKS